MLIFQGVRYTHPNNDLLFEDVHFIVHRRDKIALVGNNGVGKSTLLRLFTLSAGIYFVRMNGNGRADIRKIIVRR